MQEPVVVTGIGLVTPLAMGREATWERVKKGHSLATGPADGSLPGELAAYARRAPLDDPDGLPRIYPIALAAAKEALADAGVDLKRIDPERIGSSLSVSKPVLPPQMAEGGDSLPLALRRYAPESVSGYVSGELGIAGPMQNLIAACATGVHSLLAAGRWLAEGRCDVALAGSAEASLNPLIVSGFMKMGVLSRLPRPFDARRDGFVMGEGAGVFVLERKRDALARGAAVYAELRTCAIGSDCNHPTAFDPEGGSIAAVLGRALLESGLERQGIDYVNLHGTGTIMNDRIETRAVKKIFTFSARPPALSSTKGATGHLLGASASVEAALSCLALRDQFVPPTANLEQPDPECDLDYTPLTGREAELRTVLSLSFGFGGPIGAVVFCKR